MAKEFIEANRDKLELIAQSLLEYETLDGAQVEEIVKTGKFTPPPPPVQQVDPPAGAQAATPLPEVIKPSPPKLQAREWPLERQPADRLAERVGAVA